MTVQRFSRRAAAALFLTLTLGAPAALAHHGWSGYLDEEFTLTGVVEAVDLGNPHGRLDVRADGGVWNVVLGPPFRNERAGISDGVIEIGDTVTAHGHRHSDPERLEMKTERIEVGDQVYDIYPGR
jgi:Family of unknown function (DUF6152)